jgi:hypothetical protein
LSYILFNFTLAKFLERFFGYNELKPPFCPPFPKEFYWPVIKGLIPNEGDPLSLPILF